MHICAISIPLSDDLLVSTQSINRHLNEFTNIIQGILMLKSPEICGTVKVIDTALCLVGHMFSGGHRSNTWIMSCEKGQANWPAIYEATQIPRNGAYLRLFWQRGNLLYGQDTYTRVQGPVKTVDMNCDFQYAVY